MSSINSFLEVDQLLARRVSNFLAGQHMPALRAITVEARNGAVTLRGNVRTFFEKQLSHHSAKRVAGVKQVIDEIEVAWPTKSDSHSPSTGPRQTDVEFGRQSNVHAPNTTERTPRHSPS
jgi:hypothetical protein